MQGPEVNALGAQLAELVDLVRELSNEDFTRPSRCPGWSVAELVAHCEGMLHRLVGENAQAVRGHAEIDRVGYYRYEPHSPRKGADPNKTFSEVIRDRVINGVGKRSGAELHAALERAVDAALQGLAAIPADRVIKRSGHPRITFGEFVASRNVEFGVHTMDIAHALGRHQRVHPAAAPIITEILDDLLGATVPDSLGWDSTTYILTGTGRRQLTADEATALGPLAGKFPLLQ